MIEESAHVVATEGEFVWVETQRQSTCGGCAANQACGTATLAKVLGKRRTRVRVLNPDWNPAWNHDDVRVGDTVIIGLDETALIRGSLAVYATPLLSMFAGGLIGALLSERWAVSGESLTLGLGVAGLIAGLLWLKGFSRRIRDDSRYQPVVLRRVPG
ncbi:MAG: SoxR reducing system RseC family protein [Gammaproteobacteria bacterium]|nr:SoxR reducing system RseC family protein [Gammaproteobacteria bacterium]